jgi:hypothetical protein
MGFNPFLVSLVVAFVVIVAIVRISHHRSETPAVTGANRRTTTGANVPSLLTVVLVLAVCLVPFGIAAAALWGPAFGFATYFGLLIVGLTALGSSKRRRD